MGTVWEARHLRLPDKKVAIEIFTVEGQTEDHLSRFRREADVTSRLGPPNIVGIFDLNNLPTGARGRPARGDPRGREADRVGAPRGLQRGTTHRDLEPENVFLVSTGRGDALVKVLDFDIFKIRGNVLLQTQDALVFGTPQYMSPEQARGKNSEVDARTDVWAPGTIVHERLTETPAFAVDTMTSLLAGVLVNPSPSLRGPEAIPAHVASALDQALAKDAEQR